MFIGREQELRTLNQLYASGKFEFAVIYGRRRVGKTALISEFIKGKDAIFFTGVETNAKQNLENFSQCIMDYQGSDSLGVTFPSFQAALESVFRVAKSQRVILVIDEYPYVAHAAKSLASTLQLLIDKHHADSKLFLILCGSSMSYMEDQVLAYKAPLYGRRTAQLKIRPFDFFEVCRYFTGLSPKDKALAYGMIGGTPQYLQQMDVHLSIEENIKRLFLSPASAVFEEPLNLLKQEVREPGVYNAIMTAIASGYSKMNEIASKVGEDSSVCAIYLKNLITLGIVKKETPFGEKAGRKTIYSMEDPMFRFWYRFVPPNISLIARGAAELAYNRIAPELSAYMGGIFEEICSLLRTFLAVPQADLEPPDAILERFHIITKEQEILLKGCWKIRWKDFVLDTSRLRGGIAISSADIPLIKHIEVGTEKVMTIENKTSFQRMIDKECSYLYLGGYANRHQITFLKKVMADNMGLEYLHFGDIDAGGFLIHQNLCETTGIPFRLYCMGVPELLDKRYVNARKPLTQTDTLRLKSLAGKEAYEAVVTYMLAHNCKLEQEIISLVLTDTA